MEDRHLRRLVRMISALSLVSVAYCPRCNIGVRINGSSAPLSVFTIIDGLVLSLNDGVRQR